MADDLVQELKKVDKKVKAPVVKTEPLSIVDHILSGNLDKAKLAIQQEVIKIVGGEVSKPAK